MKPLFKIMMFSIFTAAAVPLLGLADSPVSPEDPRYEKALQERQGFVLESVRPRDGFQDQDRRSLDVEGGLIEWMLNRVRTKMHQEDLGLVNLDLRKIAEIRILQIRDILDSGLLTVRVTHRLSPNDPHVPFIGYGPEDDPFYKTSSQDATTLYNPLKTANAKNLRASPQGQVRLNLTPKAVEILEFYKFLVEDKSDSMIWKDVLPELNRDRALAAFDAWFSGFLYHELDHVRQGVYDVTRRTAHLFEDAKLKKKLLKSSFTSDPLLIAEEIYNVEVKEGDPFKLNRDMILGHEEDTIELGKIFGKQLKDQKFGDLFKRNGKYGLLLVDNDLPEYYLQGDAQDAQDVLKSGNRPLKPMSVKNNLRLVRAFLSGTAIKMDGQVRRVVLEDFERGYFTGTLALFMRGQYLPLIISARLKTIEHSIARGKPATEEIKNEVRGLGEKLRGIETHQRLDVFLGFYPHMVGVIKSTRQRWDQVSVKAGLPMRCGRVLRYH